MTIVPTYTAQIYIGGDLDTARRECRAYCHEVGECVTVEPVDFVFTGGMETGVRVGFINYPRFPREPADILARVIHLADRLLLALCQHSYSVVATDQTVFYSRREPAVSESPVIHAAQRSAISPSPPPPTIRPDTGDA